MKTILRRAYGLFCYALALTTILYAALYFGNIRLPKTIDGFGAAPLGYALLVNTALLVGFAVQHSGMARPACRRFTAHWLSGRLVRSTYVLASSLAVTLLMLCWQPIGIVVWQADNTWVSGALTGVYYSGWMLIAWATFLIDHLELFGLRQTWEKGNRGACREPEFQTPGLYRHVRHPINLGWMIVLWATPVMTVTRLVLAVGLTAYVLVGTRLEELRLEARFPLYRQYARKVPAFLPSLRRRLDH